MLSDRINRWRHRRGFGVHSPSAFMLVREVVRPRGRYRYYAEERLDAMRIEEADRRIYRLAVRLVGRLHADRVRVETDSPLAHVFSREGISFEGARTHISASARHVQSGREALSEATLPIVSLRFGVDGEAHLYRGLTEAESAVITAQMTPAVVLDGREFLIVYKTPGLSPIYVTV
ncbi:MAG: hypothetical protein HDS67_04960 [Bacteroidales bacterium]|nr:hypothetical protein [Bacteroidales bacterium]